jgi:hypothetical protein
MRIPIIIIAAVAGFMLASPPGRAEVFLAGFEDVPVMPGIAVDEGAAVAFDTPAGRIVEAYAAGPVTRDAVRRYYQAALPQLGWSRTGELSFRRDGEALTVELLNSAPTLTIRFRLAPAPR